MERIYEIEFNGEDLDIIKMLLNHEKEYYESSEETEDEREYIEKLQNIINKIEEGVE